MHQESPTRGLRKKERTRRQLLAAARRVLERKGEVFTASDVTQEADVATGTFYNYFPDRDALIDAVTEEQLYDLSARAAAADKPVEDPALRIALTCCLVLQRASADHSWARLVLRLVNRPTLYNRINGYLREDLEQGLAAGRFDTGTDDETLDQIMGLLVMTIRRIVAGVAEEDTKLRATTRALRALGLTEGDAQPIAAAGLALSRQAAELTAGEQLQ